MNLSRKKEYITIVTLYEDKEYQPVWNMYVSIENNHESIDLWIRSEPHGSLIPMPQHHYNQYKY